MEAITQAAHWTQRQLTGGFDYKETHFQEILGYALQKAGFRVSSEVNIPYNIVDQENLITFGFGRLDLKCIGPAGHTWILELKCAPTLKYMSSYRSQLRRYLRHSPSNTRGLLIIFNNRSTTPYLSEILTHQHK